MAMPEPMTFDEIVELGSVNAELLEALKATEDYLCEMPAEVELAVRAAIAKATKAAK
jgi:hypothetical protein